MAWFAIVAGCCLVTLLIARWFDRAPDAPARFEALEPAQCQHCESLAESYRPTVREVRPLAGALAWLLPVAQVASRFRVVDATWERPALCRLHYSLARSALEAALASEALELARYLESRASRLVSFQGAALARMLRRSARDSAKELLS